MNADGSGLRRLVDAPVIAFAVQPVDTLQNGVRIAYAALSRDTPDFTLHLLSLPDGRDEKIADLINDIPGKVTVDPSDAVTAARSQGLAWSPDGRRLAFVGQIDGPSVDVYLYDLDTRAVTRVSSGPDQALSLSWSPDGSWIIHEAFQFQGMGGPESSGMWAARPSGAGSTSLVEALKDVNGIFGEVSIPAWLSSTEAYLVSRKYYEDSRVAIVDVSTGQARDLIKTPFYQAAYSPGHDVWLLTPFFKSDDGDVGQPVRMFKDGQMIDIADHIEGLVAWWSKDHDEFFAMSQNDNRFYTISPDGQVTALPIEFNVDPGVPPSLYESPDKAWWAWLSLDTYGPASTVWVGKPMQQPAKIATGGFDGAANMGTMAEGVTWSPDSRRLFALSRDGLWVAQPPDFKLEKLVDGLHGDEWNAWKPVWVPQNSR